jgi:hypothetical protein
VLIVGLIIAGLVILTGLIIAGVMLAGAWAATQAFPEDAQHPGTPAADGAERAQP